MKIKKPKEESGCFGINMKRFCKEHERQIRLALEEGRASPALLRLHLEKLRWLQHERLVHLLVVIMTVGAALFSLDLTLLHPETNPGAAALLLLFAVLLAFYFAHYFFLENTTQRWYRLAEKLMLAERTEVTKE